MVGTVLQAPTQRHDVGGAQSAHDFWVLPPSGREAVEVVQLADQNAIADEAGRERSFSATASRIHPDLTQSWMLMVDETSSIWGQRREDGRQTRRGPYKLLRKVVGPTLVELEQLEVDHVDHKDFGYPFEPDTNPRHRLISHGVTLAQTVPSPRPPTVELAALRGYSYSSSANVAEELTKFLGDGPQRDVLNKLERSGAVRRHAFVWLHRSRIDVSLFWRDGRLPDVAPNLPEEVTTVWLGKFGEWETAICWNEEHGWQRVHAPGFDVVYNVT